MLTDGEVGNTRQVINLIEKEVKGKAQRVHTFGMGSGASQQLVEGSAKAGHGTHAIIADMTLVEEKVIAALQKLYLPMKRVSKVNLVLKNGEKHELKTDQHWLENDKQLSLKFLQFKDSVDGTPLTNVTNVDHIELDLYDPNKRTTETVSVPAVHVDHPNNNLLNALCA